MSIEAIEDNTKVRTPEGRVVRVRVTRRERKLIAQGALEEVNTQSDCGHNKRYLLTDLTIITYCACCGQDDTEI